MDIAPQTVGETTGDYFAPEGTTPIGSGSEGDVWLARSKKSGRLVCVKIPKNPTPELFDKIRALVYQMRNFKFVAKLLEVVVDHATKKPVGVAVEYRPGENLRDFIEREGTRDLTTLQKATLCRDLSLAVGQFTESRYILHNDLGPQNIHLLEGTLTPCVIDIDSCWLLKYRKPTGTITNYTGPFGTPGFIAPELLNSPGMLPTPESALWSLANIHFHVLYGEHPSAILASAATQGITEDDLVKEGYYPSLFGPRTGHFAPRYDTNASEIPPYFDKLFRAALTGAPQHRPTAKQWASAFESWLARGAGGGSPFWRWPRLPIRTLAAVSLMLGATAAIYLAAQQPQQPRQLQQPQSTTAPAKQEEPAPTKPFWSSKLREYFSDGTTK